jgi:hypothetical protein
MAIDLGWCGDDWGDCIAILAKKNLASYNVSVSVALLALTRRIGAQQDRDPNGAAPDARVNRSSQEIPMVRYGRVLSVVFCLPVFVAAPAGAALLTIALTGETIDPCDPSNNPAPGAVCADGSIYAGLSPDGNAPFYTTPADQGSAYWGLYNYSSGIISTTEGRLNTFKIVDAIGNGAGSYNPKDGYAPNAALLCLGLNAHGHSDWYLPALDELRFLSTIKRLLVALKFKLLDIYGHHRPKTGRRV